MAHQTDDLGMWTPTSITFIVNGIKYEGYPVPMSLFAISLELIKLYRLQKNK